MTPDDWFALAVGGLAALIYVVLFLAMMWPLL